MIRNGTCEDCGCASHECECAGVVPHTGLVDSTVARVNGCLCNSCLKVQAAIRKVAAKKHTPHKANNVRRTKGG